MNGSFWGSMFDLKRDGELDTIERAAEYQFLNDVVFADNSSNEDESE